MQTKLKRKNQFGEESIEAKPRSRVIEPTSIPQETKKLWDEMLKSTSQDVVGGSLRSVSEQLLGASNGENQLVEGEELSLVDRPQQENAVEQPQVTAEFMEYKRTVVNTESVTDAKTESEVRRTVDEIRAEIKQLVSASKLVERTVKDAVAEKAPVKPGKYHVSFFEFIKSVLRDAIQKLEDTAQLGSVFTSKKQQSKYWSSYKQHGTTFGLSGERTTATQTG